MPNIKSAKKRVRITERKTLRNQMIKSAIKTYIKKVETLAQAGEKEAATQALNIAFKKIDKAVAKGIIKKNTAARRKSKLTLQINRIGA